VLYQYCQGNLWIFRGCYSYKPRVVLEIIQGFITRAKILDFLKGYDLGRSSLSGDLNTLYFGLAPVP
jgi:hypothetical protein